MAEELASIIALSYAPTPPKPAPQNAVEATAAVSLRAKAAVPHDTLAYDVASPADAQLWKALPGLRWSAQNYSALLPPLPCLHARSHGIPNGGARRCAIR